MTNLNPATQMVIEMFRNRCADLPFSEHPYNAILIAKDKLKQGDNFVEENKNAALAALSLWIANLIGNSVTSTLNEILAVMRIAHKVDEESKKAAEEMSRSMPFLEKMSSVFLNSVNIDAVAEWLFEDGQKRENELRENSAKETKKAPIQNWMPTRWNPSLN